MKGLRSNFYDRCYPQKHPQMCTMNVEKWNFPVADMTYAKVYITSQKESLLFNSFMLNCIGMKNSCQYH